MPQPGDHPLAPRPRDPALVPQAVVHGVDVEAFCDSDGDGRGDLAGLTRGLPHLARLG
jgi:hypothetical protein